VAGTQLAPFHFRNCPTDAPPAAILVSAISAVALK
jgi:hypothetical protein